MTTKKRPSPPPPPSWAAFPPGMMSKMLKTALGEVIPQAFHACQHPGCKAHSVGWQCSTCQAMVCNDHGLGTLTLPPRVVCMLCAARLVAPQDG